MEYYLKMQNSVAKKFFAVGSAVAMTLAAFAPFAAHAAAHAVGTNVLSGTTVWMIMPDGTRRAYTSGGAFLSYGFNSFSTVVPANSDDLALPAGAFIPPQDGSIICSDRDDSFAVKGTCYVISGGQKNAITSASVFLASGYKWSNSSSADVSWMTPGSALLNNSSMAHLPGVLVHFVNSAGHDTVYLVGATGLLGIPDLTTFYSWGYSFTKTVQGNSADMAMSLTGVMAARTPGQLSPVALAPCTSNCTPVISGSVSASLASDTPAAGTLVSTASNPGQTGADLAHFVFSGTGTVTQVVVKRIGVSSDTSINNVYLYQGNTRITDAGSFSNSQVTFSNSAGLFNVNGSTTISVRVDIASGVSGQTIGAQLASFTVANGTPSVTNISGNLFTTAQVSNLATAAVNFVSGVTGISSSGASGGTAGTINAGTMNTTLWSATINIGQRTTLMKYIAFKQIGSISQDAIQNIHLFVDGAVAGNASSITNVGANTNVVVFDMTGSPVSLNTGSHVIELHGDIVKGSSFTYNFSLQTASDVVFYDTNYNVNIPLTYSGGSTVVFQLAPGVTTINAGTLTVQLDPTFSATQFVKNASQVTLGQWTVKAYGEDVKVQNLKVQLIYVGAPVGSTEGFNNLSVFVNGGSVGSSQSALFASSTCTSLTCSYTFGTTNLFTIQAGTTVTVAVKGDNVLNTTTAVASVRTDLVTPANSLQGVTSFSLSPTGDTTYTGRTLSVASSAATLTQNTGFSNQTIGPNVQNQHVGSYVIQANNADGVKVTSLTVTFPAGSNNTINPTTTLANLYIVTPQGKATPVAPSASNNFSVSFTVAANTSANVEVYADITNISSTLKLQTALNGSGLGATSNQSVTLPASVVTNGQVITVGSGTLNAPTLQSSSPSPVFVISGTQNQPAATFNFVAASGGVTITKLYFYIATSSGATSIPATSLNVAAVGSSPASNNNPFIVGTNPAGGATSTVTGLSIAVPTSFGGVDVPVTLNLANVGQNGIATNQVYTLKLSGVEFVSGGTTTTSYVSTSFPVAANKMDLVGGAISAVTISQQSPAATLIGGGASNLVGKVTVTANPTGGNVVLTAIPLTFGSAGGAAVASGSNVTLYDEQTGANASTTTMGWGLNANSSSSTVVYLGGDGKNVITPGTPRTYDVYVPVSGTFGTSPAATISLTLGAATTYGTSFTFNDVNGGLNGVTVGDNTTTYIVSYPVNSVSIHN